MVKIKGNNEFDASIVSHIENPQDQHIIFKNITFACKTIEDAEGTIFLKRDNGRFIGTEYDGYADGNPVYHEWKCSECGCVFEDEEPTYKYCPNCGSYNRCVDIGVNPRSLVYEVDNK